MKGLLLKDWYLTIRHLKPIMALLVLLIGMSMGIDHNLFFAVYPCVFASMLPVTLLGYDDRSKWSTYCCTLPYTGAQIVSAKYLMCLGAQGVILILIALAQAVKMSSNGFFSWHNHFVLMEMLVTLSFLACAVPLPFLFKLGMAKGQIAYFMVIGAVCAASFGVSGLFDSKMQPHIPFEGALPLMALAAMGLYALSWYLSIRFYEKSEVK